LRRPGYRPQGPPTCLRPRLAGGQDRPLRRHGQPFRLPGGSSDPGRASRIRPRPIGRCSCRSLSPGHRCRGGAGTRPGFLPQGARGGRPAGSGRRIQSTLERAGVAREARSPRRAQPAPSGGESPGASPRGRGLAPLEPSSPASPADLRTGPPSRPHFRPLGPDTCVRVPRTSAARTSHGLPLGAPPPSFSRRYLKCEPVMVGPGVKTSVRIRYDNPKDVGADRIANALAAYTKYGGPVVVIDFGTAVTYDAINAEGDYLGGAIAPGVEISLDAL